VEAPRLTDREILERLTRLEDGQKTLHVEIQVNAQSIAQLRVDMNTQFDRIDKQFDRIDGQFDRIDGQFDRMVHLMLGILGAFAALVAATISFAIWDRRTMIRPFESKVKAIEEEFAQNKEKLQAMIEALQSLSHRDTQVAEVLKRFHLL